MPRVARKTPGCFECARRRIICDLGTPTCLKCAKKGIECSGQGKYRFHPDAIGRGRTKARELPITSKNASSPTRSSQSASSTTVTTTSLESGDEDELEVIQRVPYMAPALTKSIDLLPKGVSTLFQRFAHSICPHMVIFDNNNGWRDIILPVAVGDTLVQQAVCVTAAQHISLLRPEHRERVEEHRLTVLSQLTAEAMATNIESNRLLSMWMALLVLLVGESVTGGSDFEQLHRALVSLCSATSQRQHEITPNLRAFLEEQTDLFSALSQPTTLLPSATRQSNFESQFRFISRQPTTDDYEAERLLHLYAAMQAAHILYLASLNKDTDRAQFAFVKLMMLCRAIPSGSLGEHALVWPYFMGAAQSDTSTDREFFVSRMLAVHKRCGFANITASIDKLQEVWARRSSIPWAQILPEICPVLVM